MKINVFLNKDKYIQADNISCDASENFEKHSNEQISLKSTVSSVSQENFKHIVIKTNSTAKIEKNNAVNEEVIERFGLRKKRKINYNLKTKKFEYDGEDSDYEEKPKRKTKRK
jgi:hypothetical protein